MITKTSMKTLKKLERMLGGPLTLGGLIRSIREGEEMTQVEFAKLLGISKQNLCDIEHERRLVSPKMAAAFAKKLGYSIDQFIQLSLQAILDRDGIRLKVEVNKTA